MWIYVSMNVSIVHLIAGTILSMVSNLINKTIVSFFLCRHRKKKTPEVCSRMDRYKHIKQDPRSYNISFFTDIWKIGYDINNIHVYQTNTESATNLKICFVFVLINITSMSGRYADLHTAPVFCHRVNEQCSIHVMNTVFASGAERKHFFMYVLPNFL